MSDNEGYKSAASGESVASRNTLTEAFTFALTPARANNAPLNYNTKKAESGGKAATKRLSDELFECKLDGLRDFLELVRIRAKTMGWNTSIMETPEDHEVVMGATKPFLDNYGVLTRAHPTKVVNKYIATPTCTA